MPFVSGLYLPPGRHLTFFSREFYLQVWAAPVLLCPIKQNPYCSTGWKLESNWEAARVGYFGKAKPSAFAPQMSWRPQYRSSKFRNVYGKVASREHCFDGIPITKNVHDNHFCAVNARFLAIVTESAGGGSFLVIPLEQVRGLAPAEVAAIRNRSLSTGVRMGFSIPGTPSCSGTCRSLPCPLLAFPCVGQGGFTAALAN